MVNRSSLYSIWSCTSNPKSQQYLTVAEDAKEPAQVPGIVSQLCPDLLGQYYRAYSPSLPEREHV